MDFKVMPVKFNESSEAAHFLYFKQHAVKSPAPEKPSDRTLFVVNVLPYMDEACVRRLFEECGKIRRVYLQKKPSLGAPDQNGSQLFPTEQSVQGFKVAYVVYNKSSSLKRALALPVDQNSEPRLLSTQQHPVHVGIIRWQMEYNASVVDEEAMKKEVDEYMASYDARVAEEERLAREREGQPDDEGWVLVTRHSRRPVARRTEGLDERVREKLKKKRKKQQLVNLYNFQLKDAKMEQLAKLRQKFEEDKLKISKMRAERKFRPY